MKALFGLLIFFACVLTVQAQIITPPVALCVGKQCTYGGDIKKTTTDTLLLKPVSSNYEVMDYVVGYRIKNQYIEEVVLGNNLPYNIGFSFKQKGNVPIYFSDVRVKNKTSGKIVKTWFKVVFID